jgi:hypothetical protein
MQFSAQCLTLEQLFRLRPFQLIYLIVLGNRDNVVSSESSNGIDSPGFELRWT